MLCLNESNAVVQRLLASGDVELAARSAELLYVQALSRTQQPLTIDEIGAFDRALETLLMRALGGRPGEER